MMIDKQANGIIRIQWLISVLLVIFMTFAGWTVNEMRLMRELMEVRYVPRLEMEARIKSLELLLSKLETNQREIKLNQEKISNQLALLVQRDERK